MPLSIAFDASSTPFPNKPYNFQHYFLWQINFAQHLVNLVHYLHLPSKKKCRCILVNWHIHNLSMKWNVKLDCLLGTLLVVQRGIRESTPLLQCERLHFAMVIQVCKSTLIASPEIHAHLVAGCVLDGNELSTPQHGQHEFAIVGDNHHYYQTCMAIWVAVLHYHIPSKQSKGVPLQDGVESLPYWIPSHLQTGGTPACSRGWWRTASPGMGPTKASQV